MKYSPKHSFFTDLIIQTINFTINSFKIERLTLKILIILFILFISILSGLIYLEILELNFCGFNKNLQKNIQKRAIIKNPELECNENSIDSLE